jgi:hypothetical protein
VSLIDPDTPLICASHFRKSKFSGFSEFDRFETPKAAVTTTTTTTTTTAVAFLLARIRFWPDNTLQLHHNHHIYYLQQLVTATHHLLACFTFVSLSTSPPLSSMPRYHQEKPQLLIHSYKLEYARVSAKSADLSCK